MKATIITILVVIVAIYGIVQLRNSQTQVSVSVSPTYTSEPYVTSSVNGSPLLGTTVSITPSASPSPREIDITLNAQNNSGQTGTARFIETTNKKVRIEVSLTGTPANSTEPDHIHLGSCATIGIVKYTLNSVRNGKSITTISATLDQLRAMLPLALNIHKSATQSNIYVACGDLQF